MPNTQNAPMQMVGKTVGDAHMRKLSENALIHSTLKPTQGI